MKSKEQYIKKSNKITFVVIVISIITILLITFLSINKERNLNTKISNIELELTNSRNEILELSADIPRCCRWCSAGTGG